MHAISRVSVSIRAVGLVIVLLLTTAPRVSAKRTPVQRAEQPSCFSDYAVAW